VSFDNYFHAAASTLQIEHVEQTEAGSHVTVDISPAVAVDDETNPPIVISVDPAPYDHPVQPPSHSSVTVSTPSTTDLASASASPPTFHRETSEDMKVQLQVQIDSMQQSFEQTDRQI
jgi:hypothetical protein